VENETIWVAWWYQLPNPTPKFDCMIGGQNSGCLVAQIITQIGMHVWWSNIGCLVVQNNQTWNA
jgi:hypothetical protein